VTTRTLVIKAGQKLACLADTAGDFEDWIAVGMGPAAGEIQVIDIRTTAVLPKPLDLARVIVTGSAAMVTDHEPWAEATAAWLRKAVAIGTPVLGICFGHQLLAHALGGHVGDNPSGVEVGTVMVSLTDMARDDLLLGDLPEQFEVNMSHRQSVLELPPGATLLAGTAADQHAAFSYGGNAWGVQFHPEFDGTVTRAHVDWYRPALAEIGADADSLIESSRDTPTSHDLLARFATINHLTGGSE